MANSETPSTPQRPSSFEDISIPVGKITQAINAKDLKIIENEALALYTNIEIDKLRTNTKDLNNSCIKLEEQTKQLLKYQKQLATSNEECRKSLSLQSKTLLILQTQYESFKSRVDEECKMYKKQYQEYLEKYKEAERVYETYHPLHKRLKELEIESRKKEFEYKMLKQKIAEEKKRIALTNEIKTKMFHCSIVKFVQAVVNYWKARDLAIQLKEAEEQEQKLIQELQDLELLVAKKEKQAQLPEKPVPEVKPSPTEPFKLPPMKFAPPPPASTASYSMSSFTKYPSANSQETLLHVRNKLEQRKLEWSRHHFLSSNSSTKRACITDLSFDQKRRALQMNVPAQNLIFNDSKINIIDVQTIRTGNTKVDYSFDQKRRALQMNAPAQNPIFNYSKMNIIDVQTIPRTGNTKVDYLNRQPPVKKLGDIKENLMPPNIASHGDSQQSISLQSQSEENNKSMQRPLANIHSERMQLMQPNNTPQKSVCALPLLQDITKIVPTTSVRSDRISSQDLSKYSTEASQNCVPSSQSQQLNISSSPITQASSQKMTAQFSKTNNYDNIFSRAQTQEDYITTHNSVSQITPHALPVLQEQTMFSSTHSQDNSSRDENKDAILKTSIAQLQYRSQTASSQSQAAISLRDSIQTQSTAVESCTFSQCGVTPNLNHMLITENQPEQSKGADKSAGNSQSSTFSQKCQQLPDILAKEIPEMDFVVTSAPMINPTNAAVITSPFFNQSKPEDTVQAENRDTAQAPLQIQKDVMFAGKSIEELLDNSALFHDQEMPTESSFIEENAPVFSPDYSMNEESALNMQPSESTGFNFNFQQPQSSQPNEVKPFFSTSSGLFNMFF